MCVCGIKEDMEIYQSFDETFNREKGSYMLSKFKFDFSSRISHDIVNIYKNFLTQIKKLGYVKFHEKLNYSIRKHDEIGKYQN